MQFRKWILVPVIAAGLLMGISTVTYSADENIPEANPYSGDKKAIRSGRSWYRNVCGNCHGGRADGRGERGTGADLRKFKKGFKGFVQIVWDGRKVKGRIQYMPAWRGVLSDKDIYQIGAYLETLAIDGANWK
jgi:mono/diheme cytochrome c family protein